MNPTPPEALRPLLAQADALDHDASLAAQVVPALGRSGVLRVGVPREHGGDGGTTGDALEAIAAVAAHSLTAAFVFWGQRASIEYLLQSPNAALRDLWLPRLLAGEVAGATGLSNAMKFLSGLEALQVQAMPEPRPSGAALHRLDGQVPWATNLRPQGFLLAVAVERRDGGPAFIAALPSDRAGLQRSDDLDLIALRGSNTASVRLTRLTLGEADLIAPDARAWLPAVRPAFLALQCGLSVGLARASLAAARAQGGPARSVLREPLARVEHGLTEAVAGLKRGLQTGQFAAQPVPLFEHRIALAHLALAAVQLELQASGGRAYHRDAPLGFARRWREAAFLPIVTPSLTQLQAELDKRAAALAGDSAALPAVLSGA